ncbi:hypothetical protein TIFTF001_033572 [Ficus carica]|uniref:Uncharacterized protein n=1 Tax=Ficus carica TaxID=3494 RepID=A0AA88J813_FICCA|nr:hypothetical protein TIFTF001_033572 [Ficus carica]
MDEGENTWCDIIGEVHGTGPCCFSHPGVFFKVPKQDVIGIASKTLLSKALFKPLGPQPHPIQHSLCLCYNDYRCD